MKQQRDDMDDWQEYALPGGERDEFAGSAERLPALYSPQLDNTRDIVVYLPATYRDGTGRFPVVYMHDGQNLFHDELAFAGAWRIDRGLEDASRSGLEAIVVALPNAGPQRMSEYSPFVDARHGGGGGDAYLQFIVETVKPRIDKRFRTVTARDGTGIAGSSLGGLISLYGFFRHPTVFGFCGAMSPALWFADGAIFDYIERAPFVPGRIYMDCGTGEGERELRDVRCACEQLRKKGYQRGRGLLCVLEPGAPHNERAWGARTRRKLEFLLPRQASNGGGRGPGGALPPISRASADWAGRPGMPRKPERG
jgi:predicted alpha/beta superfamily hydrolase